MMFPDHLQRTKVIWWLRALFLFCLFCPETTSVIALTDTPGLPTTTFTTTTNLISTTDQSTANLISSSMVTSTTLSSATTQPFTTSTTSTTTNTAPATTSSTTNTLPVTTGTAASTSTDIDITASTVTPNSTIAASTTDSPCSSNENSWVHAVAALCALLVVFIISTVLLTIAFCYMLSLTYKRRKAEREKKQFIFEEGMDPPKLWLDPQNSNDDKSDDKQPTVWEVSTFSPSPDTKHATMPLPSDSNGRVQQTAFTMKPVVAPKKPLPSGKKVQPKRVQPKRVAPPPPKKDKRKKQNKTSANSDGYAEPSPYLQPISTVGAQGSPTEKERVYDVPKRQRKWKRWNIYKEIDVSKVQPPNQYADLTTVKPTT